MGQEPVSAGDGQVGEKTPGVGGCEGRCCLIGNPTTMHASPTAQPADSTVPSPASRLRDFLYRLSGYRSLRLTTDGTRFVVLAIAVGVAAINTGNNLLYLLFAMMLSLIVVSGWLSEQCLKHISVIRRLPAHLYAGEETSATFMVTNTSRRMPALSLRIMDVVGREAIDRRSELLYVPPGATAHLRYPITLIRRGRHRLDAVKICTRFPFGFFDKSIKRPVSSEVIVYPAMIPLSHPLIAALNEAGQHQPTIRRGQGTTLSNLRLYQPGDDSRAIHWKTTARKSQLIIKEIEAEDQRRVRVLLVTWIPNTLPSQAMAARFERAVSLAASVVAHYIQRGYEVQLCIGGDVAPSGMGEGHLHRMLTRLALCRPDSTLPSSGPLPESTDPHQLSITVFPWADSRTTEMTDRGHVLVAPEA